GNILLSEKVNILPDDTAADLHDKLMTVGAGLLVETVKAVMQGEVAGQPQPQDKDDLKPAPKIHKEDCLIDWKQPVGRVYNFIRGLSPYPAAYTHLEGKVVKIYGARPEESELEPDPGT